MREEDASSAPDQRTLACKSALQTTPEQRLLVCHERALAPVSVYDEDIAREQRLPVTYAEVVASVRPVDTPARISVLLQRRRCRARVHSLLKIYVTSPSAQIESVHVVSKNDVEPRHRLLPLACPPHDAATLTQLPELAWGDLLRALKGE